MLLTAGIQSVHLSVCLPFISLAAAPRCLLLWGLRPIALQWFPGTWAPLGSVSIQMGLSEESPGS